MEAAATHDLVFVRTLVDPRQTVWRLTVIGRERTSLRSMLRRC